MSNDFYAASGTPSQGSPGTSAVIRAEFNAIVAAFDKMPALAGAPGQLVVVNPAGNALTSSAALTIAGLALTLGGTLL